MMNYPLYMFAGLAPSIIWLMFYLKKDRHPEPNLMILKIFFWGMLSALPAIFIEKGIAQSLSSFTFTPFWVLIINNILAVAFVEELLKYLVVRGEVFGNKEFDEPVDAMIYMIVAGLGFASSENILVLFQIGKVLPPHQTVAVLTLRFIGATFLHALCSAIIGFFLAYSLLNYRKDSFRFIGTGLIISSCLHGLYNFFIIEGGTKILVPIAIIINSAFFVSFAINRLKKIHKKIKT